MDSTPVIDLTAAGDSPPPHQQQAHPPPSSSSSSSSTSSSDAPLVARSLTAARNSSNNNSNGDARNVNAVAGGSGSTLARRVPYPTNAASTPIDLTDDDIEYLGEHRLNLPQPHASGSDARPVPGDNYSLMDRLRDVAGMPFSRHARQAGSSSRLTNDNLRIINEDPLRYGAAAAGPGPAAVAAANARARRSAAAIGVGGNGDNINNAAAAAPPGNPPAGLNARRNRQRVRNAYNANNNFHQPANDPGEYYYRRVPPPPRRAPRGGRRQRNVYEGLLRNLDNVDQRVREEEEQEEWDAAAYLEGDHIDELELELPHGYDMAGLHHFGAGGGGAGNRGNRGRGAGGGIARGYGAFQNIMEMLGFGRPNNDNFDPVANLQGFWNHIQPANYNPGNPPKRKVKAYSVRQSHPNFNKKKDGKDGFERDVVPPPEVEEEEHRIPQEDNVKKDEEAIKPLAPSGDGAPAPSEALANSLNTEQSSSDVPIRNKGKGRALELDIPLLHSTTASTTSDSNSDIPVLDLAHDSPNGSGSTASSALFSGKISNSTRGTSIDNNGEDSEKAIVEEPPPLEPPKPATRTIRAPVCTSCSTALYLNQSSSGRPYILVCGHVICRGCLDTATARFKGWTAEEVEGDSVSPNGSKADASSSTWKGARLKETFQEIDRSRSSTVADTASDIKGKKRASGLRIGAPGSRTTASTSNAAAAMSSRPSARSTRAAGRRRGPLPDYAELDDVNIPDSEAAENNSYIPKTAAREASGSSSPEPRASQAESADETLPDLASVANGKGKGRAVQPDSNTMRDIVNDIKVDETLNTTTGKRKRTKADEDAQGDLGDGGKSTSSTATNSKTKKQKVEKPSKIDPDWLTCPVRECKGGTDLGRPIGSKEGAWELFV